ncbi:hypothetical protein Mgra_00006416 [Meloidogyne graminicola]|uniref:Uncharacterized protein n=1 Tax=Meloidogyne graminicola TaxID=189291 RepID=A0A8S9ZKX9_9BILA|nr:hypothetical protein Mgra_00006416 [Meloidogyne graminicola]
MLVKFIKKNSYSLLAVWALVLLYFFFNVAPFITISTFCAYSKEEILLNLLSPKKIKECAQIISPKKSTCSKKICNTDFDFFVLIRKRKLF